MITSKQNILTKKITLALVLGLVAVAPTVWALPSQGNYQTTNSAKATIDTATTNVMNITGNNANTSLDWASFNVAKAETVNFKKYNDTNTNYLNLIHDTGASSIYGAINGAGGNVYLVNPNGILFGADAKVTISNGSLVASTRPLDQVGTAAFAGGGSPLTTLTDASKVTGNITNLGTLQASSVVIEGNNVTLSNTAKITSDGTTRLTGDNVTVKAAGIITAGHAVTETTTRSFTINGTAAYKTVHDYKNAMVTGSGYTGKKLDGTTDNAVKESMLVDNVYDLQNMDAKLNGNYMLSGNIDASETKYWDSWSGFSPVGAYTDESTNYFFTGSFDGANHTISGLTINRSSTNGVGLFGYSKGTIQNVGLVGGNITGQTVVGGVVGTNYAPGAITNVYNTGMVTGVSYIGGVAGTNSGTIANVYNTGAVSEPPNSGGNSIGGVVGANTGTITNSYNTGDVTATSGVSSASASNVGGVVGYNDVNGTIKNVYNTGTVNNGSWTSDQVGGVAGQSDGTIVNAYNTGTVQNGYSSGTFAKCSGVVWKANATAGGTVTNAWFATTNAAGEEINGLTTNVVGTGKTLVELKTMDLTAYGFDATAWRTYATDGSDTLVATTPMLQAFKSTLLDDQIAHTAVQYGTAEKPLTNIYQTSADLTLDMSTLTRDANMGVAVYGHNLTVNNFTPTANDTSSWGSYAAKNATDTTKSGNLVLQNDNGFTINKDMRLEGTNSITLSAAGASSGAITDYGKNITPTLNITAKNIVLDTDRVDTAAGNAKTTVNLNAAGTAKAGYTPTGTMWPEVNGASVSVPDYAKAAKRTYYPTLTVTGGATLSEGQWVKNVVQLQAMGNSSDSRKHNYFLANDIDASATSTWNNGQGFVPVGDSMNNDFQGAFDGLNHTIYGLTINRPTTNYVGLFGRITGVDSTIQNVGMIGGSMTGQNYVGGVVGETDNGSSLVNVYNTSPVSGFNYVGGITGRLSNSETKVENAYNTGSVSGSAYVGGIVGDATMGNNITINNVYNIGAVSGKNGNMGGIVGAASANVTNALWAKDVSFTPATGYSKANQSIGNLADTDTVKGVTLAEMKKSATYDSWKDSDGSKVVATTGNAGTTWRIYEGNTTPLLSGFFRSVVSVTGLADQTTTYNGQQQNMDISQAVFDPDTVDTTHMYASYGTNAGTYSAIYSDQLGYDLVNTNTLTIKKAPLTLTTAAQTDYTYGANVAPTITDSWTGYVNDETIDTANHTGSTSYNTAAAFNSTSRHTSDAGDYTYTYNGNLIFDNYAFSTDTIGHGTGTVTVKKADLTITPAANVTATYGDNLASKLYTYDTTNLVNGDTSIKNVSGAPTYNTTAWDGAKTADASTTPYSVDLTDAGTLSSTNYTFTVNSATPGSVTIGKATAQVKPTTNVSLTYGDVTGVTNAVSYAITGLLNGDSSAGESGTVNYVNGALNGTSKTQNVGTYNVTISADTGLSSTNYIFAADNATPGTITLTQAPLKITAQDVTMTYGQAESNLTYGYDIDATNKLVNDDTAATVLSGITYTNSAYKDATHTNNVGGTYTVTVNVPNLKNYSVTTNTGAVTMNKATAKVKPTTNAHLTYGDVTGVKNAGSYAVDPASLVNDDSAAGETGTVNYINRALNGTDKTQDVGTYNVTIGTDTGLSSMNYTFAADNTTPGTITLAQAPLKITAKDVTMTYGQAESDLTYGYGIDVTNKLVNGDEAATVLSGITYTNSAYKDATHTNNVGGAYTVAVNVPNLKNYSVTTNTGAVTMNKADVTLTPAVISGSVTYGDAAAVKTKLASETYTNSGLKNEDTTIAGLNITWVTDALKDNDTHTGNAGGHSLSLTGSSTNYNITGAATANAINIVRAPLTINANAVNMTYGQAESEVKSQYGYSQNGITNGDDAAAVLGTLAYTNSAYATQVAGNNATKTNNVGGTYNLSIDTDLSGLTNYVVTKDSGAVTMNKAAVTLTPNAFTSSITYGDYASLNMGLANAGYTPATSAGAGKLLNGDTAIDGLTGVTYTSAAKVSASKTNDVGKYSLVLFAKDASSTNYNIIGAETAEAITLTQAPLEITAKDVTMTYGQAESNLTYGYDIDATNKLVNDDIAATVLSGITYTNSAYKDATHTNNVGGTYTVTVNVPNLKNYSVTTNTGAVTMNKATVKVKPTTNAHLTYGDVTGVKNAGSYAVDPASLVNDDSAAGETGNVTYINGALSDDGSKTRNVGNYAVTIDSIAGLSSTNYIFAVDNTMPGTITLTKATATVTPNAIGNVTYGNTSDITNAYGYTVSNLVNDDTSAAGITGAPAYSTAAVNGSKTNNVGTYDLTATAGSLSSTNYDFTGATRADAIHITPAALVISASNASGDVTYGDTNLVNKLNYSVNGLVNGDSASVLSGAPAYTTGAWDGTKTGNAGTYNDVQVARGTLSAVNYDLTIDNTKSGSVTITPAALTLTANPVTMNQGDVLPVFTGSASGYVNGDNAAEAPIFVYAGSGTPEPGSAGILGYLGGKSSGLYGTNYYLLQAVGNSSSLTVNAAMSSQDYSRAVTSLIPRHGNQIVTPLYGVYVDQPASTVTTQTAQMEAVAEEQNATVTLNAEQPNGTVVTSPKRQQELNGGYYIDLDGKRHQLF